MVYVNPNVATLGALTLPAMSFAEAIAALRNLFKVSAELPLAAAVDEMRSVMCIEATGSLVRDVDALVAA